MRRSDLRAIPFVFTLALALGSVVASCASLEAGMREPGTGRWIDMNTGPDLEGIVRSGRVFASVERVTLIDAMDKSRRVELRPEEYSYDPATTILTPMRRVEFADPIYHLEGRASRPALFRLADFSGSPEDILVVLGDRCGILGFDYFFDAEARLLRFRDDIDVDGERHMISYPTASGSSSTGDWPMGEGDELAYIETRHNAEVLSRWYDAQESFYFMEAAGAVGEKPRLTKRQVGPEELAAMKGVGLPVIKSRIGKSDRAISRELGFDVGTPSRIELVEGVAISPGKMLVESSTGKGVERRANALYFIHGRGGEDSRETVIFEISPVGQPEAKSDASFPIEDSRLDLGLPVDRRVEWAIVQEGGLDAEPRLSELASYSWEEGGARFNSSVELRLAPKVETMIKAMIEYRKRGRR